MSDSQSHVVVPEGLSRIREELSHPELPPQVATYYGQLLDRITKLVDNIRRSAFLLLIVAGSIELIGGSGISDVDLGPFKIDDIGVVERFLPLVAAFLTFDVAATGVRYMRARQVAIAIDREYRPLLQAVGDSNLSFAPMPSLFGPIAHHRRRNLSYKIIMTMMAALRVSVIISPLVLEVYWFYELFREFGPGDFAVWLSLTFSTMFLVYASLLLWSAVQAKLLNTRLLTSNG